MPVFSSGVLAGSRFRISIPYILLILCLAMLLKQRAKLILKSGLAVVLFLMCYLIEHDIHVDRNDEIAQQLPTLLRRE